MFFRFIKKSDGGAVGTKILKCGPDSIIIKSMRTLDNFSRAINDLVISANTDIAPIIQPTRPEGGYFGVPRAVLCYINFLGLLYDGWSGKKNDKGEKIDFGISRQAKKYIKEILGQIDEFYITNGNLLYDLYRHGTIHIYSPKKMVSKKVRQKTIEWLIYKGDREDWQYYENKALKVRHLEVVEWETNRYVLSVSISILYNDLIESIDLYKRMVYSDNTRKLLRKFSSVADALDTDFDQTPYDFWSKARKPS